MRKFLCKLEFHKFEIIKPYSFTCYVKCVNCDEYFIIGMGKTLKL